MELVVSIFQSPHKRLCRNLENKEKHLKCLEEAIKSAMKLSRSMTCELRRMYSSEDDEEKRK